MASFYDLLSEEDQIEFDRQTQQEADWVVEMLEIEQVEEGLKPSGFDYRKDDVEVSEEEKGMEA